MESQPGMGGIEESLEIEEVVRDADRLTKAAMIVTCSRWLAANVGLPRVMVDAVQGAIYIKVCRASLSLRYPLSILGFEFSQQDETFVESGA
jgi:hypothetical protein